MGWFIAIDWTPQSLAIINDTGDSQGNDRASGWPCLISVTSYNKLLLSSMKDNQNSHT